jgi:hypothetical protein
MRLRLRIFIALAAVIVGGPAMAQNERELGVIQRYGAPWRYNHRDWSGVHGPYLNPGVCWYWNSRRAEWVWGC